MTIKELAEVAGCNTETVRILGKKLYPNSFKNGIKTNFNEIESIKIMNGLPKKNLIEMPQVPTKKQEGVDYEVIGEMIGMAIIAALAPAVKY